MDKIRYAQMKAEVFNLNGMFAADNEYGDVFDPAVLPHLFDDGKAVELWHPKIQEQSGYAAPVFPEFFQSFGSVLRRLDDVIVF